MTKSETIIPPEYRSPETIDEMCEWLRARGTPCAPLDDTPHDEDITALFAEDMEPTDLPDGWAVHNYAGVGAERVFKVNDV